MSCMTVRTVCPGPLGLLTIWRPLVSEAMFRISSPPSAEPKKPKAAAAGQKKVKDEGPPPLNLAEVAVCNAAGALHHLTFIDEAKVQVSHCSVQ